MLTKMNLLGSVVFLATACGAVSNLNLRDKKESHDSEAVKLSSNAEITPPSEVTPPQQPDGSKLELFKECLASADITAQNIKEVVTECYLEAGGKSQEEIQALIDKVKATAKSNDIFGIGVGSVALLKDGSLKVCLGYGVASHPIGTGRDTWIMEQASSQGQFKTCLEEVSAMKDSIKAFGAAGTMGVKLTRNSKTYQGAVGMIGGAQSPYQVLNLLGGGVASDGITKGAAGIAAEITRNYVNGFGCAASNINPGMCLPFAFSIPNLPL